MHRIRTKCVVYAQNASYTHKMHRIRTKTHALYAELQAAKKDCIPIIREYQVLLFITDYGHQMRADFLISQIFWLIGQISWELF